MLYLNVNTHLSLGGVLLEGVFTTEYWQTTNKTSTVALKKGSIVL